MALRPDLTIGLPFSRWGQKKSHVPISYATNRFQMANCQMLRNGVTLVHDATFRTVLDRDQRRPVVAISQRLMLQFPRQTPISMMLIEKNEKQIDN